MSSSTETTHGHAEHKHVDPKRVFVILLVATIIEILLALFKVAPAVSMPLLLALSFVKAALVALYFMHLRYEKLIYGIAFIAPTLFALLLIVMLSLA
ncbi:MAG: cytochrome C oxidase subunit IV family protein [Chloroflexota bacterium]|jgi:cytochrome c oxidase subunit 4|nr:cytochrome C oxidase subunit IV family protein [Chloroflexota bacterium]